MLIKSNDVKFSQPRFLLLGGNGGKWKAADRPGGKAESNGIEAWCYAFTGDYSHSLSTGKGCIAGYDIVMINLDYLAEPKQFAHLIRLAGHCNSGTKLVAMIEGAAPDYIRPNPQLRELLAMCSLVNVINEPSLPYFRALTGTRAEFIGIPYPVESAAKYKVPFDARKKKAFLSSFLTSRYNDYLVARNPGLECFGFEQKIRRTVRRLYYNLSEFGTLRKYHMLEKAAGLFSDPALKIYPDLVFGEYLRAISDSYLAVNLDYRYTWSRFVIDSAVLGIPMITTKSTGHGPVFFPETTIDNHFQIGRAIELRDRLLDDKDFYRHVADYPADKLEWLKHENMKAKLMDCLIPAKAPEKQDYHPDSSDLLPEAALGDK